MTQSHMIPTDQSVHHTKLDVHNYFDKIIADVIELDKQIATYNKQHPQNIEGVTK